MNAAALAFPGACDTHMHFYDGRYKTAPDADLFPPDAGPAHYRLIQAELGLERVVVVQPTTYGHDNRCQLAAVDDFGRSARAVVVIDSTISDSQLSELHAAGARGARFHMLPGGAVGWEELEPTAQRIADLGWHVQLQLDGNSLAHHADRLLALPTPVVVDHIGRFMPPPPSTDTPAVRALMRLVDAGRTWVKLSAPYESSREGAPTFPHVLALVDALVSRAPERLLWASNWPHPGNDSPPTTSDLQALAVRWLPDAGTRRQVLVDNPADVYGFDHSPGERSVAERQDDIEEM